MTGNKELVPHIGRLSRSKVKSKRRLYKIPKKSERPAKPESPPFKEVPVGGEKNGEKRLVATTKPPKFYPAEDVRGPKKSRKTLQPTKLRASITPGTVLILLAGRFRGKRVVFLKQLSSGLLLITGPYAINGVPLRRVNQAYVIATSTRVDLGDFEQKGKVNDSYFAKPTKVRSRDAESEFFVDGKPKPKDTFPEAKASLQKSIDKPIIETVKKTQNLVKYLKASWGLSKGQHPHQMVF